MCSSRTDRNGQVISWVAGSAGAGRKKIERGKS